MDKRKPAGSTAFNEALYFEGGPLEPEALKRRIAEICAEEGWGLPEEVFGPTHMDGKPGVIVRYVLSYE